MVTCREEVREQAVTREREDLAAVELGRTRGQEDSTTSVT